jgi:RND family efflux transporter MFP subunit
MKKLLIIILALSCLLIGFFTGKRSSTVETETTSQAETPSPQTTPTEPGLQLTPEQIQIAGLSSRVVQPESVSSGFEATGSLVAPPTHLTQVNSPISGVVESIHSQVGESVHAGQTLAVLRSQEVAQAQSEYHQALVELQLAQDSLANSQRLIKLDDLTNRPVEQASQEVSATQAQLATYRAQEKTTKAQLDRLQKLLDIGITSQQQLDQAHSAWEAAKASRLQAERDLKVAEGYLQRQQQIQIQGLKGSTEIVPAKSRITAARERLQTAQSKLDVLGAGLGRDGKVPVNAPTSGVILSQSVAQGENLAADQPLFQILDPRLLWLWVSVYESDLARLSLNQKVRLSVVAYPERDFEGTVSYIDPSLDPASRTARARVKISNTDGLLSPGMLATVKVLTDTQQQFIVIPTQAVVRINDQDFVYLEPEPGTFERSLIVTAQSRNDQVVIAKGLEPGDRVVVQGSYYLKSEELKGSFGDDD